MELVVAKKILKANDQIAEGNRSKFDDAGVFVVNILGSPGSGKTALLEALFPLYRGRLNMAVIEGDLASTHDAERIEKAGVAAVQINTDGGCHLDANMIAAAAGSFDLRALDVLFIENVGNLVCTAGFDLGERLRVVVLSVPEGDDKVIKYPPIFQGAGAVVISKSDLLEHSDFDTARLRANLLRLNPSARVFELSAKKGAGVEAFADWLIEQRKISRRVAA